MIAPRCLPLSDDWRDEDDYVNSLLDFATNTEIFRNLCGGVHILDFLTREPDLYTTVLPEDWVKWFDLVRTEDVLNLLLHQDLKVFYETGENGSQEWNAARPPESLLKYVSTVRRYCLLREPAPRANNGVESGNPQQMPAHIAVGMKPKKIHEVENFANFVNKLTEKVSNETGQPVTDIVDFGSGQNYLGRTLASPPYHRHVIAVERRHHVVQGARGMDVHAKLANKEKIMRNKKEWKRLQQEGIATPQNPSEEVHVSDRLSELMLDDGSAKVVTDPGGIDLHDNKGRITYVEHDITDGKLDHIIDPIAAPPQSGEDGTQGTITYHDPNNGLLKGLSGPDHKSRIVVSVHSCGNLTHHGLRSLVLNPSVTAVAMIGCCYNLITERLGPATYKLPILRSLHPRLESTSNAFDCHGFPMSKRLESYEYEGGKGIRLNITARMMAVQAPYNWGPEDSEAFFKRHFWRALLQRILVDLGVVDKPTDGHWEGTPNGINAAGVPLIVGSLRKAAFLSFHSYARAALEKLSKDPVYGNLVAEKTVGLSDETLANYETQYFSHKKNLSIIWALMAFSAGVVESMIAVDRWLYLREQDCVQSCWVEPVFDYAQSPRNLVVVGIKKRIGKR